MPLLCAQRSANHALDVALDVRNAADAEGLDEHVRDIRRKERRQRRSEVDVLHTEMQEREEDDDRLLLIPCDVVDNRQFVHIGEAEDLLELQGDERQGVRIVALL